MTWRIGRGIDERCRTSSDVTISSRDMLEATRSIAAARHDCHVRISHLRKSYRGRCVVEDLSLQVEDLQQELARMRDGTTDGVIAGHRIEKPSGQVSESLTFPMAPQGATSAVNWMLPIPE